MLQKDVTDVSYNHNLKAAAFVAELQNSGNLI